MESENLTSHEPAEEQDENEARKPALVINIHSWSTPIFAVLMLAIGLFGGYFGRPLLAERIQQASVPTTTSESTGAELPPPSGVASEDRARLMEFLVSQTRHFKGNPDAPVTMIEFSDFQ